MEGLSDNEKIVQTALDQFLTASYGIGPQRKHDLFLVRTKVKVLCGSQSLSENHRLICFGLSSLIHCFFGSWSSAKLDILATQELDSKSFYAQTALAFLSFHNWRMDGHYMPLISGKMNQAIEECLTAADYLRKSYERREPTTRDMKIDGFLITCMSSVIARSIMLNSAINDILLSTNYDKPVMESFAQKDQVLDNLNTFIELSQKVMLPS